MKLIHYGHSAFDPEKFHAIENVCDGPWKGWIKPKGGLWCSPVRSRHSWKRWCKIQGFRLNKLDTSFTCTLAKDARILTIKSADDYAHVPLLNPIGLKIMAYMDFEWLAERYDAVHLTAEGERATRMIMERSLFGWDCESVLILNKDKIIT